MHGCSLFFFPLQSLLTNNRGSLIYSLDQECPKGDLNGSQNGLSFLASSLLASHFISCLNIYHKSLSLLSYMKTKAK